MSKEPESAGRPATKRGSNGFKASLLSAKVGTPFYLSPEQREDKGYDEKVDIFSLGLILFELCSNFNTMHQRSLKHNRIREDRVVDYEMEEDMSHEATLIKLMTNRNPKDRPSAKEILELPVFKRWKNHML